MKHRGILFSVIFIGFLILLYGHPVWFPQNSVDQGSTTEIRRDPPPTSWNYEPIATEGFAEWIGQNISDFNESYGNPEESFSSGFSFEFHHYELDHEMHLELTTENKVITSIKFLGNQDERLVPFFQGMTMNDLTKLTMVYPNFNIHYEGRSVGFELMEEDMNYRPLIAFDNGSFAILFFSQKKNESTLSNVMYLSKEMLLKLAPYQITEGVIPKFTIEETADWEVINQNKQNLSKHMFQYLRERDELSEFTLDITTQINSEQLLGRFFMEAENLLTTERAQKLQRIQRGELIETFSASSVELEILLDELQTSAELAYLELPIYDPTFTILTWYSTPYLHTRFMHQEVESLGVAFSKENMVVLLEKLENQTEDSDEP